MPTHPMVPQDMMHMNMNPNMAQPHHMMASGIPHMGMPPNPMHHEHMSQSSMYNNSESAYHHHMQSLGCPPQHIPQQQPPPQQLQQLPVQQPILPCAPESQIVSNSVPYSDPIMPPVHLEQQPHIMPPEQQQPQQQQQPLPQQQEQLQQQQIQPPPLMSQSPVELESQPRAESPLLEQISQSPPLQSEVQSPSPLAETDVQKDSNSDIVSPPQSPNVEKTIVVENDDTSVISRQSRSLSPAELNEPQSLERDCWSGSEHDPPPPTLTAEVSPPGSPKVENETAETSVFNFTEDEEPPPPLHSLPERSPRKLKGLR